MTKSFLMQYLGIYQWHKQARALGLRSEHVAGLIPDPCTEHNHRGDRLPLCHLISKVEGNNAFFAPGCVPHLD